MSKCCPTTENNNADKKRRNFDWVLWSSTTVILAALGLYFGGASLPYLTVFTHTIIEMFHDMWWGVLLGLLIVGFMGKVPKTYFNALLGRGDRFGGIMRATIAGLVLDLCNHGILLVGAKLYERGASLGQIMAFLIASPWNSLSLTLILIALIGIKWAAVFIVASAVIALLTGLIYMVLVDKGALPANPNTVELPEGFSIIQDAKMRLKTFKPSLGFFKSVAVEGWDDAKMLLRWLLLGVVIAASIRAFVPGDVFADWFGPSLMGLALTLIASTIIEVCSEGSAPIASELLHQAEAPGNAFTFLMAGVATDYTEVMIIRETTKSWAIALSLPLITVPQIVLLGYIMNLASS